MYVRNLEHLPPPPKKKERAVQKIKISAKFWRYFGQLRGLIANISEMQQDIVNSEKVLQTDQSRIRPFSFVNFGPQKEKNRTGVRHTQNQLFSDTHNLGC